MANGAFQPWFEKFPSLFQQECRLLEARGFCLDEGIYRGEGRIVFHGRSQVEPGRSLHLYFPAFYPSFPPLVFDDESSPLFPRHHHAGTRELCLFGPAGARWCPSLGSTGALDEVEQLIAYVRQAEGAKVDDQVPEPVTTQINYTEGLSFFVPPPVSEIQIPEGAIEGRFEFVMEPEPPGKQQQARRGWIFKATGANGDLVQSAERFPRFIGGDAFKGMVVSLPPGSGAPQMLSHVETFLASVPHQALRKKEYWFAFLIQEQTGHAGQMKTSWVIARAAHKGAPQFFRAFPYREEDRQARIPGLAGLKGKRVMFVGCGCLGSKIAVALAASGLSRVTLVDSESMEPYNAVRHELGVYDFGRPKVQALVQRLIAVNPAVHTDSDCKAIAWKIGDARSPLAIVEEFIRSLAECDMVIDTTGSHHVSRWLNEQCHDLGIPIIYASVTNGAWGGEVVRVVPHETACWVCWSLQYYDQRPSAEPLDAVGFFAPGCDQPSFTGTTYEAGVIANFASMMAIQTLLREELSERDFKGDYLRWNGRSSEGVPQLGAEILAVHSRDACYLGCGRR